MKKPFSTIVVKTIVDGEEVKVRFTDEVGNHRKFLAKLRGVSIAELPANEGSGGNQGAQGGGGIIFVPPPTPDPILPTISGVFELSPSLRQFQGSHTDAVEVHIVIQAGENTPVVDELAVINGSSWSIDLSGYVFDSGVTYSATATAKSSTNHTDDIVLQDTYTLPELTVIFQLEEPYVLNGTYSNANNINVVVRDEQNLLVAQGAPTFADGLWEFDLGPYDLLDGMTYSVEVEATNNDGNILVNASSTFVAPAPEYTDLINDPDLVLVGQASVSDGTLLTNWETASYPYHYAEVPDNGRTDYDVGDVLTITVGRLVHPDDTNTFAPLASKHNYLSNGSEGYHLSTYNPYIFGYVDDGTADGKDAVMINGITPVVKGVWEHYALVFIRANRSLQVFQDGQFIAEQRWIPEFPPADTTTRTIVGATPSSSGTGVISPLRAKWRDYRFYKRALTRAEIEAVSNELDRS